MLFLESQERGSPAPLQRLHAYPHSIPRQRGGQEMRIKDELKGLGLHVNATGGGVPKAVTPLPGRFVCEIEDADSMRTWSPGPRSREAGAKPGLVLVRYLDTTIVRDRSFPRQTTPSHQRQDGSCLEVPYPWWTCVGRYAARCLAGRYSDQGSAHAGTVGEAVLT